MKKGDKFEDGGRVLIVDEVLDNGKYLTHVLGKVGEVEKEPPLEEVKAPSEEELRELAKEQPPTETTEETAIIDGEPIAIETVEPTAETTAVAVEVAEAITEPLGETAEVLKCQYCDRVIKSKVGLASHEKACKENPVNK